MINPIALRNFVPLHALSPGDRQELARHSYQAGYQPGQVLFHRGDAAKTSAYLVSGEVELVNELGTRTVVGGSEDARHPLASGEKRAVTATCLRAAQVIFIDRLHLDLMLTWAQSGAVEVQEMDAQTLDWMGAMLRNPAFHRIPPANIPQIIARVEQIEVPAGQTIIRQGDVGDYYYVLTDGTCQVTVQDPNGLGEREVDRIQQGNGFGEEALVSGNPRNATVRAVSRCALVRLAASDFTRLLRDPLLRKVDLSNLPRNAVLIDVRLPEEYARGHLEGAVNLPLRKLRTQVRDMDGARTLVVYCDTGRRSASAAFLLTERGFDARWIEHGVNEAQCTSRQEVRVPPA